MVPKCRSCHRVNITQTRVSKHENVGSENSPLCRAESEEQALGNWMQKMKGGSNHLRASQDFHDVGVKKSEPTSKATQADTASTG